MDFYPILEGAGGGASLLLGAAHIYRTADTYCAASSYVAMLRKCEFRGAVGDPGVLDPATGAIAAPPGAKVVRFTFAQDTNGCSALRYTRLHLDTDADTSGSQLIRYGVGDTFSGSHSSDLGDATQVKLNIYFSGSAFTLSSNWLVADVGLVEFFG